MRKSARSPVLFILLIALISMACSLSAGAPAESATSVPTMMEPTATLAVTSTAVGTPDIIDSCLLGAWTMDVYALNNKFLDLTGSATMYVTAPSSMVMEYRADNSYALSGETTMRFDIPNSSDYFEVNGAHAGQGSYGADGSVLTIVPFDYHVDYGAMRAVINGQSAEAPLMSIPIPENGLAPPAYANYRCTGNRLEITYDGPLGSVTEEWNR